MARSLRVTARSLRVDPAGPALAAIALVVFFLQGFLGALTLDPALYAYSAQQFADGVPPYVAVLNRAGPLAHIVPGLATVAARLLEVDGLLAMRGAMAVVSALCVWAAYLAGRDLFRWRWAGAVTASTLLLFEGFLAYATTGPREKTTMVLFLTLAVWLTCRRQWWFAGAAIALVTLTWQGAFFPAAATALVVALGESGARARLGALLRVAVGGLVVTGAMVAYFAVIGALAEFREGFYAIHIGGYSGQFGWWHGVGRRWRFLENGFGWSRFLLVAGVGAMLLLGALGLRRDPRTGSRSVTVPGVAVGLLTCVAWSMSAFQGWPDAFIFLPFAALGIGGLVALAATALPSRWQQPAAAVLVSVSLVVAGTSAFGARSTELVEQRGLTRAVMRAAGPGATLQSINATTPLVLLEMRNPSRYQVFIGGVGRYLDDTLPGGLEGLARDIAERRPTFLAVKLPGRFEWLAPTLERHYQPLGGDGQVSWFATNAMPEEQVQRVRGLLRTLRSRREAAAVRRSLP